MRFFLALLSMALIVLSTPVWASGETELDIGGQIRFRPEMQINENFNSDSDADASFTGQRIRLNIKGSDESVTAFVQLQDARVWGSDSNVGTSIESDAAPETIDLYQAWFQINDVADTTVTLKMGRQPLAYGSQRLLGHLGWKDEARTFDGIKVSVKTGTGKIDFLVMKLNEEDYWSDSSAGTNDSGVVSGDEDENLNGVYGMFDVGVQKLDVYYLNWTSGATKNINTMGVRIAGKAADFDYTAEYVIQSGDWDWLSAESQEASALAVEAGYNMGPTRVGFLYAMGSGDDDSTDKIHKTFVFPFHTNHAHYGHMDFFSWGNMNDIALRFKTKVMEKSVVKVDYHILSLADAKDDWLNVVGTGNVFAGDSTYTETAAGSELDITFVHPYSAYMKIIAGYSMFTPGAAVEERNDGKKDVASWAYLMMIKNF